MLAAAATTAAATVTAKATATKVAAAVAAAAAASAVGQLTSGGSTAQFHAKVCAVRMLLGSTAQAGQAGQRQQQ